MTSLSKLSLLIMTVVLFPAVVMSQNWTRMELTGTGLSIETPVAYKLIQDKPDPFIQDQTAKIIWSLNHNGIFSTVTLTKTERGTGKTPRQEADSTAQLFKEVNGSTVSRVTNTMYLGEQAALFEEEFVENESKQRTARRMVFFGTAAELKVVNISYPVANSAAKTMADRIFASVQKQGSAAQGVSKGATVDWKPFHLNGLRFETPIEFTSPCRMKTSQVGFVGTEICYKWGANLTLNIQHRKYPSAMLAPEPAAYANGNVKGLKDLDRASKLNAGREYNVLPMKISGTEAAKMDTFVSVGSVGNKTEEVYVKNGSDFWIVRVNYSTRWDFEREAAERIIGSLSIMPPSPTSQTAPQTSQQTSRIPAKSSDELIKEGTNLYAINDLKGAIAKYDQAKITAPDNGLIYFHRAVAKSRLGDSKGAIDDYNTAIMLKTSLRESYYNRGTIYYNTKNYSSAIADLTRSLEIDPAYNNARYNRGLAFYAMKDNDKALADFTETIARQNDHANSYIMRSRIYCQKGLIMSAIKDQEKAISLGENISKGCQ